MIKLLARSCIIRLLCSSVSSSPACCQYTVEILLVGRETFYQKRYKQTLKSKLSNEWVLSMDGKKGCDASLSLSQVSAFLHVSL